MSIYTDLLDAVDNGKKFKVDLINKSLWINKKQIIKEGEIVNERDKSKELIEKWDLALNFASMSLDENPWSCIEILYKEYKHSIPSENSNKKSYFKALLVDELTDADLAYGYNRNYSQAMLEGYILLGSLKGWIKWEYGDHWFWKSDEDENLVIIRNWIE